MRIKKVKGTQHLICIEVLLDGIQLGVKTHSSLQKLAEHRDCVAIDLACIEKAAYFVHVLGSDMPDETLNYFFRGLILLVETARQKGEVRIEEIAQYWDNDERFFATFFNAVF